MCLDFIRKRLFQGDFMKLIISLIVSSFLMNSVCFGKTVLTCKPVANDGFVKSLILFKDGDIYRAKMETAMQDGVVDVQLNTPMITPTSTNYTLVEDHDLKVTLVTYEKNAVVLTESIYDASEPTTVQFLKCK